MKSLLSNRNSLLLRTRTHGCESIAKVHSALEAADDPALERLAFLSPHPDAIYHHIRLSASSTSRSLGLSNLTERSALWVLPIISVRGGRRASCLSSDSAAGSPELVAQWIAQCLGAAHQVRIFDFVPPYDVVARLSPGEVRSALKALVNRTSKSSVQFKSSKEGSADEICVVPELSFFVGSASTIGETPTLDLTVYAEDFALGQRVCAAIAFCTGHRMATSLTYRPGTLASFSDGILAGILYWVAEVCSTFATETFDLTPTGFDETTLLWKVQCATTLERYQITKCLRFSQLGVDGVAMVASQILKSDRVQTSERPPQHS